MDPNLKIEDLKNFNPPEPAVPKKPTPEQKTGEGHVEAAVPVSCTELEQKWMLFEKRMDYGWNFFDFHAKQRMTCFNFFLIFVGFVLNAYATFFKDRNFLLAGGMAFTAAGLSLLFIFSIVETKSSYILQKTYWSHSKRTSFSVRLVMQSVHVIAIFGELSGKPQKKLLPLFSCANAGRKPL